MGQGESQPEAPASAGGSRADLYPEDRRSVNGFALLDTETQVAEAASQAPVVVRTAVGGGGGGDEDVEGSGLLLPHTSRHADGVARRLSLDSAEWRATSASTSYVTTATSTSSTAADTTATTAIATTTAGLVRARTAAATATATAGAATPTPAASPSKVEGVLPLSPLSPNLVSPDAASNSSARTVQHLPPMPMPMPLTVTPAGASAGVTSPLTRLSSSASASTHDLMLSISANGVRGGQMMGGAALGLAPLDQPAPLSPASRRRHQLQHDHDAGGLELRARGVSDNNNNSSMAGSSSSSSPSSHHHHHHQRLSANSNGSDFFSRHSFSNSTVNHDDSRRNHNNNNNSSSNSSSTTLQASKQEAELEAALSKSHYALAVAAVAGEHDRGLLVAEIKRLQGEVEEARRRANAYDQAVSQILRPLVFAPRKLHSLQLMLTEVLTQALSRVEQVHRVNYVHCSLPCILSASPHVALSQWHSLERSLWDISFAPPWWIEISVLSQQFVEVGLQLAVKNPSLRGSLEIAMNSDGDVTRLMFASQPELRFDINSAANLLGLVRLPVQSVVEGVVRKELARWLTDNMVAPNFLSLEPAGAANPPGTPTPASAAAAAAATAATASSSSSGFGAAASSGGSPESRGGAATSSYAAAAAAASRSGDQDDSEQLALSAAARAAALKSSRLHM